MGVEHDAQRLAIEAGQPHGQGRIVAQRRPDPDHDRLVGRAHDLDAKVGDRPGDAQARVVGARRGEPVRRLGELERHARPPRRHAQNMAEMVAPRLRRPGADRDGDPRGSQPRVALAADERIGVLHRRDDAGDAGRDDGVDARAARRRNASRARASHRASRRAPPRQLRRARSARRAVFRPAPSRRARRPPRPSPGSRRQLGWAPQGRATAIPD